ncbi:hypothetical protein E4U55_004079 [Claviceps digitariae]|nr:hypothetical protein E4U55_004079 [Claviceps digitariae]
MLTEGTDRGAHQEPYAEQAPMPSSEQDPSVSFVFNTSLKSADDARSSISSDKSDSKPPRSAMRRTFSASKLPQSPRRVRFDFMGEEVLPTSSPQHSAFIAARISSPEPADNEASFTSNLATDPGEDEEEPPPRKVSSSDALRALSRAPLDEDGTVWTVVNSDSDDSAADEVELTQSHELEKPDVSPDPIAAPRSLGFQGTANSLKTQMSAKTTLPFQVADGLDEPEDDSTDDEDILSMAKPKRPSSCASTAPSLRASSFSDEKLGLPVAHGQNTGLPNPERADPVRDGAIPREGPAPDQKEEEMFYFEEDGPESISRAFKYKPEVLEEESEEESSDEEIDTEASMPASLYATSPAIKIPMSRWAAEEESPPPSMISTLRVPSDTIGSYKGRPLMIPILRNAQVLNQINSPAPIQPVAGSSHDGSPAGDVNVNAILGSMDERLSTARSFKERLMIEDMMEAAKKRLRKSGLRQV